MEMVQNLIRNLSAAEKLQFYSYHTKPVLNFQALFTDGSSNYMNPVEPKTGDEVTDSFPYRKRECRACILACKW